MGVSTWHLAMLAGMLPLALRPWGINGFMLSQAAGAVLWIYGEAGKPKAG